jgi:hypothetical protein
MGTGMMTSTATMSAFAPFIGAVATLVSAPQYQSGFGSLPIAPVQVAPVGLSWHRAQLNQIAELGENWDGYGAEPIEPKTIRRMGSLLDQFLPSHIRAGNIVPGADGSLQAEWHLVINSFGLLVGDDGVVSAWLRHRETGAEVERWGFEAFSLFQSALNLAQDV